MRTIPFDHAAANALLSVLERAEQRIDRQGKEGSSAVDIAMEEFAGGYARVFEDGADLEQRDRAELIEQFVSLAQQIRGAQQAAEAEQQRLEATALWGHSYAAWQAHPPWGGLEACAPGNATELKREAIQLRENGETLSGDEYVPAEG